MEDTGKLDPAVQSILSAARERAAAVEETADRVAIDPRGVTDAFARARDADRMPVIAEIKPTSPTTEGTRDDDPVALAESMVAGGAAALSVLTEPAHFGGQTETVTRVREAVDVPVLRKDFIVDESQLDAVESDVILLIARFLGDELPALLTAARDRGFQVLVEVHDRTELAAAVDAGATYIGVNNRDLARLVVDLETVESVAPAVPDDVTLIAESGISTPDDVRRMHAAGADALLIGSAIMAGDVEVTTRMLTRAMTEAGGDSEPSEAGGDTDPTDKTATDTVTRDQRHTDADATETHT